MRIASRAFSEAEVLAALNHPDIAAIYGLERSGATTALVMELVEGEDLSQRIARGAIPLDEALPIAKQITRGDNMFRRNTMKNTALKVWLTAAVLIPVAVYAQPRPGNPTTATVITKAEIDKISATEQSQRTRDENAKVVDIGDGWSMELGIIHRASTRNPPPAAAAGGNAQAAAQTIPCGERMATPPADAIPGAITHDNQTEGYYVVSGGGTAFIDGHVVNGRHSTANPDGGPNGPGCGGLAVGSRKVELKVGDVLIVPPGVIHGWADIPDHVDYLSFRPSHGVMKNGWVNPTIASK